jgi:hypothetical protein
MSEPEVPSLGDSELTRIVNSISSAIGEFEFRRLTDQAMRRSDTVYVFEYEGVLAKRNGERLSDEYVSLFNELGRHQVAVYILTEKFRHEIVNEDRNHCAAAIITCANDEAKAEMVRIVKDSHQDSVLVCCGKNFMAMVDSFRVGDFAYVVHGAHPVYFTRAYDVVAEAAAFLPMYSVPDRFVRDLISLLLKKLNWRASGLGNHDSYTPPYRQPPSPPI